jgi:uncharacterized MAPEG superfamily protein
MPGPRVASYFSNNAQVWVVMRILYVPLYFIQIPFARSLVWFVSVFALVVMQVRLFQ